MSAPILHVSPASHGNLKVSELTPEIIAERTYEAADRLEPFVKRTDTPEIEAFGSGHAKVFVKSEIDQPDGSFKGRGAGNAVFAYASEGAEFFVTASAGNHGRGFARAVAAIGLSGEVVVPETATEVKKREIQKNGIKPRVHGAVFDEALAEGIKIADDTNAVFVPPYADSLVISGQATIAKEMLNQVPDLEYVVLPVGGAGLLVGVASYIKEHKEGVKVVAAQVHGNRGFIDSLLADKPLQNRQVDKRFEGIAVSSTDPAMFDLARLLVDEVVVLDTSSLYKTIYEYKRITGKLLETAGAVGPAASKVVANNLSKEDIKIGTVASGANPPSALDDFINAKARRATNNRGNWLNHYGDEHYFLTESPGKVNVII